MNDRPEKAKKTRVSVTLTKTYLDAMDHLIEGGIYLSRGEAVLEGLRVIFRRYRLEPFRLREGSPEEGEEENGSRG